MAVSEGVLPGSDTSPEKSNINFASCADLDLKCALLKKPITRTLRNRLCDAPSSKHKTSLEKTFPHPRLHDLITKATEDELTIQNTHPTHTEKSP